MATARDSLLFVADVISSCSYLCRAVRLYGDKDCLGSREQLSEEDEVQPNGKVFKKVSVWIMEGGAESVPN